ncbi:DUF6318 family protein [Arthrobacter sp. zg-Y179]|uniref:DUF6318 family protein n=1 Tax=Arthrobacter sp. zg-Y179 TaxID=2894188 RepID=UPI001E527340|nr:DUF6318 family protein [Arthrobacter sp. zg-Y179]MCC9175336.1 DUF6318 family protein [Arthrobacter sp. zg-Y179]
MSKVLRRPVRVRLATAAAAVVLLFLTACSGASGDSGDSGAGESPSSPAATASETPTPTPTPSATYKPASAEGPAENVPLPVMPEEAKVESKEGLEAFARYWYEAANYGYETGDVELVKAISSPECTTCLNYYEVVDRGFAGDDWMAKSQINVQDTHSDFLLTPENRYQAVVQLRQDDMEYYAPAGHLRTDESRPMPSAQLFEAAWTGQQWIAVNIATLKAG